MKFHTGPRMNRKELIWKIDDRGSRSVDNKLSFFSEATETHARDLWKEDTALEFYQNREIVFEKFFRKSGC